MLMVRIKELVIRYYSPHYEEKVHKEIISLLNQIRAKHGITYEIFDVPRDREMEIYKSHFARRARVLTPRIGGKSVANALRSRGGRGYAYLRGLIALIKNENVEWFTCYEDPLYDTWKAYDKEYPVTLGFLKMLLNRGPALLAEILERGKVREHEKLIDDFIKSSLLFGEFQREVPVGKPIVIVNKYGEKKIAGRRFIDLICKRASETWVIEVEPELSSTALGQALIYGELYKAEHPNEVVKVGIVCKTAYKEVYDICEKYVDKVFVLGKILKKGVINLSRAPFSS